jgi:nucleotide-binding universal stress UspA family protein
VRSPLTELPAGVPLRAEGSAADGTPREHGRARYRGFARSTITGTQDGEYKGIAPTGRHVASDRAEGLRRADGKIVGYWCLMNVAGLMRQRTEERVPPASSLAERTANPGENQRPHRRRDPDSLKDGSQARRVFAGDLDSARRVILACVDRPIVVAVDGSPAAEQAVAVALDLASAQTAKVVFVHYSPIAATLLEAAPDRGPSQEAIEGADGVLRAAAKKGRERAIAFELEIVDERGTSDIAASLAGIAEARGASLLVVGSRGRGTIAGAVLGSVSRGLLSLSRVPVLVTHAAGAGS